MLKKIYGTYRAEQLTAPEVLPDGKIRFEGYHPAQYLNSQFADWNRAGLTNVVSGDAAVPSERYVATVPVFKDGVPTGETTPKLTRFIIGEYEDTVVDPVEFARSMRNVGAKFDIDTFTDAMAARDWIRANTDLAEDAEVPGKFLVSEASEMAGRPVPARYLVIA